MTDIAPAYPKQTPLLDPLGTPALPWARYFEALGNFLKKIVSVVVNSDGSLQFLSQAYAPQATLTDGASIDWNLTNQQAAIVTLGGNRTLNAPTNQKAGATYVLVIKQDGTGSRTLAWNAAYKFPAGIDPTLSTAANAVDMVCFVSDGTSLYGVPAFAFA